jgi:uncharacterized iron-regulated protein
LAKSWEEGKMKKLILIVTLFIFSGLAHGALLDGKTLHESTVERALSQVHPGDVVVLGETHGTEELPPLHMQIIENISKNHKLSVGMEFFEYPQQGLVDAYLRKDLLEIDFLKQLGWGAFSFSSYRQQVQFPIDHGGTTVALNAPRTLTNKVAKNGLESLNPVERELLPPAFSLGNERYFLRFKEVMGSHVPEQALPRYFAAQSIWDETMAWKANEFLQQHPDQVLVIIVGEFHVQYGGGLPDRLKARGAKQVHTFSFVNLNGLSLEEIDKELQPSAIDGQRADFIWTTDF